jgi:hypothetical protein
MNPSDPDTTVDPDSTRVLLRIDQPQFNHNAGAINFGPDGMLYIALGDGGGADDRDGQESLGMPIIGHGQSGNAQNPYNVLGSFLRIDVDGSDSDNGQYGIPSDNPFTALDDARLDEIYAFGFRNPFRFSFDLETGQLYVADVGQNDIEEIAIVNNGDNHGWNIKEGNFFFDSNGTSSGFVVDQDTGAPADLVDPIAEYDHDEGIAIVGGFVYRGPRIAELMGLYVTGDFALTFNNDGRLFYLDNATDVVEFELADQDALGLSLLGFGQDDEGELYVLANATGTPFEETGVVLRIESACPADINGDGVVNIDDLFEVLNNWGASGVGADVNFDRTVNIDDLFAVLNNWGTCD